MWIHPACDVHVALVAQVSSTGLTLAVPLPGGAPPAGAKLQAVAGFVDREGGQLLSGVVGAVLMQGKPGRKNFSSTIRGCRL